MGSFKRFSNLKDFLAFFEKNYPTPAETETTKCPEPTPPPTFSYNISEPGPSRLPASKKKLSAPSDRFVL